MIKGVIALLIFALAELIATVFIGWWAVPVVAALWTLLMPRRGAVRWCSGISSA